MSLVERALKKLQEAQAKPPGVRANRDTAPIPIGSVVDAPPSQSPPVLGKPDEAPVVRRSNKIIHVSREGLRAVRLIPPQSEQRRFANEYRAIKRPLLAAALGKGADKIANGQVIMLASAVPGEGKTFTSINLAMSMANEKDITVLLVDADLAKPHISRTFGVDREPGLIDALQDATIDIESLVIPTDIRGLSILPAGRPVENATELLASTRMKNIVARLREADPARVVLFDSPPLLLTNESRVLADVVGQVVIVVRAGQTAKGAVLEAIGSINEGKPVSLVLNQSITPSSASYYGYHGEYGDVSEKNEQ